MEKNEETATALDVIVGIAAQHLNWTEDRVRLAIAQGVMADEEMLAAVLETGRVDWVEGWGQISLVLKRAPGTVRNYYYELPDFREIIQRGPKGLPRANRKHLVEWRDAR